MYKILFTSAISQELKIVKNEIKKLKLPIKIDFFSFWMWSHKTILNLTKKLENNNYDFIVNIGICWYNLYDVSKDISEAYQISRIYYSSNNKELLVPIFFKHLELSSIFCSDVVIYDWSQLAWEKLVDMESYWFEITCDSYAIPRIMLKIPFDLVWQETINYNKEKAEKVLSKFDYYNLIKSIMSYLDLDRKSKNFITEVDYSKYFDYYNFTFSEREIFKKLYNKYSSLYWSDFDLFFTSNNNLSKKDFLIKLKNI